MAKIPLHNLFESVLHIRDIETPEAMDALIAKLEKEAEKEEKAAAHKNKSIL